MTDTTVSPSILNPYDKSTSQSFVSTSETFAQYIERRQKEIEKAEAEANLMAQLQILKSENSDKFEKVADLKKNSKKTIDQINKNKKTDGSTHVDSGKKGVMRWLCNGLTSIKNIGKSLIGYDKKGKWHKDRAIMNGILTAAGIGLCFVPGVGQAMLIGGAVVTALGIGKGIIDLKAAEKTNNQQKIDEAQQDIMGNAILAGLSGLKVLRIGKLFRTAFSTADKASSAANRSGAVGKTVEALSNAGKDSVNAFRYVYKPKLTNPVKNWKNLYTAKSKELEKTLTTKIQEVDNAIMRSTNQEEILMLNEQKAMLIKNKAELMNFKNLKAKTDMDKLAKGEVKRSAQENIERAKNFTPNSNSRIRLRGGSIKAGTPEFRAFQSKLIRTQKAYDKAFKDLMKARENMMRKLAQNPDINKTALDEYVSVAGVKKKIFKPSTWLQNKYQIAIGGRTPSYCMKTIGTLASPPMITTPALLGLYANPVHSNTLFLTQELTADDAQAVLAQMEAQVEQLQSLETAFDEAKTTEEAQALLGQVDMILYPEKYQQQMQEALSQQQSLPQSGAAVQQQQQQADNITAEELEAAVKAAQSSRS